jgi:hypothetical protein
MYETHPVIFDRRHGPDVWKKMLTLLAVLGWVFAHRRGGGLRHCQAELHDEAFWPLAPRWI